MTSIRELIKKYQSELGSTADLLPERASKVLVELSALTGVVYQQVLLLALDSAKSAARAKITAEPSESFQELTEAKNAQEVLKEMIRAIKFFLREKADERKESVY